jgi:signal transduction histidine kinase
MRLNFQKFLSEFFTTLLILFTGFTISIFVAISAQEKEDLKLKNDFSNSVQTYYSSLKESFDKNILLVRSLQSYFSNPQTIKSEEFKTYSSLLLSYYPGVQALSWVPKIHKEQVIGFLKQAQKTYPNYFIKERTNEGAFIPVGNRDFYYPVYLIEPQIGNEPAIGFDLYSNLQRSKSIDKSLTSKNISVSSRIKLVQEKSTQSGILIIAPVFNSSNTIKGVVTGVFRVGDVIETAIQGLDTLGLDFSVYETSENTLETNLFSRRIGHLDQSVNDLLRYFNQDFVLFENRKFQVGDKTWNVKFIPAQGAFQNARTMYSWIILITGLVLTFVIAWLNRSHRLNDFLHERFKQSTVLNQQREELTVKVLHSEKLAALGQLAAGVAHEINNPIAFVASNITTLKEYFESFEEVLKKYTQVHNDLQLEIDRLTSCLPDEQAKLSDSLSTDSVKKMNEFKSKLNFEFLIEDCHAMMSETQEGIQRVKLIIQDLKDFARTDSSNKWVLSNLHKSLKSTLNILTSELKYKAEVKLELGNIPEIECIPSQINQVFMNLIINASQAMQKDKMGTIIIRSGILDCSEIALEQNNVERVWFEVEDNGAGIAQENLSKIFDPFFTTKEVGVGTGLGLSVSHGIVLSHKGSLTVRSTLGLGTVFRIELPVFQL